MISVSASVPEISPLLPKQRLPFAGVLTMGLPCRASAGYLWRYRQEGDGLLVRTRPPIPSSPDLAAEQVRIGFETIHRWDFTPVRPGRVVLLLEQRRPWEEKALETYVFIVDIEHP